eukprot:gene18453-26021_t
MAYKKCTYFNISLYLHVLLVLILCRICNGSLGNGFPNQTDNKHHLKSTKTMNEQLQKRMRQNRIALIVNIAGNLRKILEGSQISNDIRTELIHIVTDIITHIPRYLVEIKPMLGDLFSEYLKHYTHWSYTDPDIVWGNIAEWVEVNDLMKYDFITFAKAMDAA